MSVTEPTPGTSKRARRPADGERNAEFDQETQKILEDADAVQTEIDSITERCQEEVMAVEQSFNIMKKPHLARRNMIVSEIPHFWLTTIKNHPDLTGFVDETEEDCLTHLSRFEVEEFDNYRDGYKLKFYFTENPYFENEVLQKEYHLQAPNPTSESTQINWKEGMKLFPSGEQTTPRKRKFEPKSFFHWFEDNIDATSDDLAEILREDIWQNPLQYYLVPDADNDGENGTGGDDSSSSDVDEVGPSEPDKLESK